LKPRHSRRELADDRSRQGYPHKEAHTETMVSALFAPPARMVRGGAGRELPGSAIRAKMRGGVFRAGHSVAPGRLAAPMHYPQERGYGRFQAR
jgi:hypothetical protein